QFPRPPRFGKTLFLSTLQAFIERGVDEDERAALFGDLAIWHDPAARAHMGRYPVVGMTFKDIKYDDWPACLEAVARVLSEVFLAHRDTIRPALGDIEAEVFDAVAERRASPVMLAGSLQFLTRILHRHHGERAVLLVDEYDTPIHAGYAHGYYDQAIELFRNLLSGGFKDNAHLQKGVLTGILRVAKESIFSGLNNLDVFSILRSEHAASFGFTEPEVASLAVAAGAEAHLDTLRDWYNGYVFGGQVIYNPWSVLKFLDDADKRPQPHWVSTSSDDVLHSLIAGGRLGSLSDQEALLRGEAVERDIIEPIALRDIERRADAAVSLLLFSGYLTATEVEYGGRRLRARLRIPNREVLGVYETTVLDWLDTGLSSENAVDGMLQALLAGDADRVERDLERLLLQHVSHHDLPRPAGELPYHMFVLGLLVRLAPEYDVRSNRETGFGRADVLIAPRQPGRPGVVMELKTLDPRRDASPEAALDAAMRQIEQRAYAAELATAGAAPIHVYAAVFDGKRAYLRARTA
ncbi:MAG TPA: AAA family ATPase, partial [Haliangium sp.]|nr:AAA family ATPase [Haliangium sp.]